MCDSQEHIQKCNSKQNTDQCFKTSSKQVQVQSSALKGSLIKYRKESKKTHTSNRNV